MSGLIPLERIEKKILLIRGNKVMLDEDLAELYGVQTKVLLQAVKRNSDRFPKDFMFQLNIRESRNLTVEASIVNISPTFLPSKVSPCSPVSCIASEQ